MPLLATRELVIDYAEAGSGPPVMLVHSAAVGNWQWKRLMADLAPRFRTLAVNLYGYGATPAWPGDRPQRLDDQARLIAALAAEIEGPLALVGHSFGAAVAMQAALGLADRLAALVLIEPNPFYLLARHGRIEAFAEICWLHDIVKSRGGALGWSHAGEAFADYWGGAGSWTAMSADRRDAFLASLRNTYYEWDAVMNATTPLEALAPLAPRTLLAVARDTKRPIREIGEILVGHLPGLAAAPIAEGGHMAPLAAPHAVNPLVAAFLDRTVPRGA